MVQARLHLTPISVFFFLWKGTSAGALNPPVEDQEEEVFLILQNETFSSTFLQKLPKGGSIPSMKLINPAAGS